MDTSPRASSEGESPKAILWSSKKPEEDEALSLLMSRDPALGQVMKILFGKLDETNKKLDNFQCELRRDLNDCQDQISSLLDTKVMQNDRAVRTETVQELEKEKSEDDGREVSEACLGIPTVLRKILEQLSDKELICLSLVNKLWNYEARSELKERGCLKATINSGPTCQRLVLFASDLQQMHVVPFTGMNVKVCHFGDDVDACQSLSSESLDPPYQVILDQLPWKHLSVHFDGDLKKLKDCPALSLVRRILEDHSGVLEELSFSYHKYELVKFFQIIFNRQRFPSLKILKFVGPKFRRNEDLPYTSAFVKTLVSCAPNLEKLCLDGRIKFNENVMEGSSAVLVPTWGLYLLEKHVCESLIDALRTESIQICSESHWRCDEELLTSFVPKVIQASRTTLKSITMDLLFALPLMCYGICLENVTNLMIWVKDTTEREIPQNILELVKSFDFTHVFPRLNKVEVFVYDKRGPSLDDIRPFIERGKAVARTALPDRAINIRHLELNCVDPPLSLLAQFFPHVKTISVKTCYLPAFKFALLWEHFHCLEELRFDFVGNAPVENLDCEFCGIFPEEVADLGAKDDDFLKAVNIVPVMPSITCMKGLRLFSLRHKSNKPPRKNSDRMFSKVTALIGFSRCPALSVKFETTFHSAEAMDHMKPYVTVVTESSP